MIKNSGHFFIFISRLNVCCRLYFIIFVCVFSLTAEQSVRLKWGMNHQGWFMGGDTKSKERELLILINWTDKKKIYIKSMIIWQSIHLILNKYLFRILQPNTQTIQNISCPCRLSLSLSLCRLHRVYSFLLLLYLTSSKFYLRQITDSSI